MENGNRAVENTDLPILAVINEIPGGIAKFSFDEKFAIFYANTTFFEMMGFSQAEYAASFSDTRGMSVDGSEAERVNALVCGRDKAAAVFRLEYRHIMPDQSLKWIAVQAACEKSSDGREVFNGTFTDITKAKYAESIVDWLKEKSQRDPLTSFYNKIVIEEAIDEYFLMQGERMRSAFMVIDIDDFKRINDHHGHLSGDAVLMDVARGLKNTFRSTDLIGRIGGDEFVVLVKNVQSQDFIKQKARDICQVFHRLSEGQNDRQKISCSIGICMYPEHGKTYRELFEKADRALYDTKGLEKDNFTIYGIEEPYVQPALKNPAIESLSRSAVPRNDTGKKPLKLIQVFELLFDTKDIQRGIQEVIDLIGKYYDFDCIYILEHWENKENTRLTYEWYRIAPVSAGARSGKRMYYGREQENLFFCEDVETAPIAPQIKADLIKRGVKAIMQYALYENEKFTGMIAFEEYRQQRKWQDEEIESLTIVTKFIGSYLVKMRVQSEIEKLAYTDALTGMWNLNKFKNAAEKMLCTVRADAGKRYAMVCFDIKKFRYINDTFGFDVGDEILLYIANRLKEVLQGDMIFARMSADKFLVLTRYKKVNRLVKSLNWMMEKSQYFVSVKTGRYRLIFNSGIYLIDKENLVSVNLMIDQADIARSKAHSGHDNNCVFYNETFRQNLMREKEIEDLVDYALEYKEFVVYYQPKIDLMTGKIKGAEGLVRWISPTKGFMSPVDFIPLFEKNGVIAKLDFYVFERVFSDLRRWIDEGRTVVPISVNLSRVHLSDGTFIERLLTLSKKYGISPNLIEIELTESVFMENISSVVEVMHQLKILGFLISIDDFGSGYSSLRLLRDLPVDYLKLDKDFLDQGDNNIREQVIIMNVIRMAKTLGIKVVSEGVETVNQATFLKSCACDLVQGFLYAKPMPVEEFEGRCARKNETWGCG